ncbi:MAG: peptide chain release factor 2 [Syntrophobacteraceae bacterium]|nr:peptide chain release factor 2 [Syntrophobacteraceae bacterium]
MNIDVSELKAALKDLSQRFQTLGGIFDIAGKEARTAELEKLMGRQDFWDNPESGRDVLKERSELNDIILSWRTLASEIEDNELLFDMAVEEDDEGNLKDVQRKLKELQAKHREMELWQMLSDENDDKNAIVTINAGAGGTEAQDWTEMLLRMYLRWCERKGLKVDMIDLLEGEEAGVKNVTFTVSGPHAHGMLKAESGVHRLVRISPFDASGRRHTSFAAVLVFPEIDDKIEIEVKQADLRVDTFRASGAGGQHVNKTSSAVRLTHLPTGIVVQCQNEKSQHRNREIALKILKARLYEREKRAQQAKMQQTHDNLDDIAWGNQIRSYVLQPYRLVKDHRTNVEKGNVESVLDGELDDFIEAYLLSSLNVRQNAAGSGGSQP